MPLNLVIFEDNEILRSSLVALLKKNFATVKHAKPPSSRKGSVEWFVVAQGFKGRRGDMAERDEGNADQD